MKRETRGTATAALAVALAACAADPYRLDAPRAAAGIELAPYALREECVALGAGERVAFYFASVAPVAFNIHYHEANAVIVPVAREQATEGSGEFVADRKDTYCLTWEAGAEASVLEYRVRAVPAR